MMYWHVSAKPFYLENLSNYSMRIRKSVRLCLGKSSKFLVRLHYPHPPYFMSCGGKKSAGCMHLSTVPLARTIFHGPKPVWAIEVKLYLETNTVICVLLVYKSNLKSSPDPMFAFPTCQPRCHNQDCSHGGSTGTMSTQWPMSTVTRNPFFNCFR